MPYDVEAFRLLQRRLVAWWPMLTVRTVPPQPRVIVVVSSMTVDMPGHLLPMVPAYEERYLCLVLALARSEHTRVVYVTSVPMLPRLADYYLDMMKGLDPEQVRRRLTVVSVGDPSPRPLTHKLLERPLLLARLRELVGDPRYGLLMPFLVTPVEAELAVALDIPVYGPDPALARLGTKSGSRHAFEAAGVPLPRGRADLRDRADVVDALAEVQRERPVRRAAVKLDTGFAGVGNAVVHLDGVQDRRRIADAVDRLVPEAPGSSAAAFLEAFERDGGVVEEWVEGDESASPSVQLRASPLGEVEVLSTHDQVLGGPNGQTYLGCRFPASPGFIEPLTQHGLAVARELSRHGVIGRFGVDFVVVRHSDRWQPYAVEVNLRNGGTTHPAVTLAALTDGRYDQPSGQFLAPAGRRCYVATDHLERPDYRRLTPDDVLDVVREAGLSWDTRTETGVALHMVSGVAVGGSLGATAIGRSPGHADRTMAQLRSALDRAATGDRAVRASPHAGATSR